MHLLVLLSVLPGCRKSTFQPPEDTGPTGSLEETPTTDDTGSPGEVTGDDTDPQDSPPDTGPADSGPPDSDPPDSDPPDTDPPDSGPLDADGDGYTADVDCDDGDEAVHPDADEHCDGRDEDCDDEVDEDAVDPSTWYLDLDSDGFGSGEISEESCTASSGYVAEAGDCDDVDPAVHPDADEVCDGDDEDCDGLVDDDDDSLDLGTGSTWYADADGDGYGDPDDSVIACDQPTAYTDVAGDCDDADDTTYEGGEEICNDGVDNDCDDSSDGCSLEATYDLADADVALRSNGESDHAEPLAAGDLDGDGLDDLAVGLPGHDGGGSASGSVFVHAGPLTAALLNDGVALTGDAAGDSAGTTLAVADLDDDGQVDLLVGAPAASPSGADEGQVHLVLGPITADVDLGSSDAVIVTATADAALGCALATGDVDGDGIDDALLGAWGESGEADSGGGAWLLLGPLTNAFYDDADPDAVYTGPDEDGYAGQALAIGDWDGDGVDDLGIAYGYADSYAGRVYATTAATGTWSLTDSDAAHTGETSGDFAGSSLASGDLDGDGVEDLIVGAYGQDDGGTNAGAVYVVANPLDGDASLADAHATLTGAAAGDLAGVSVAVVGDVDGDGAPDVLVGATDADPGGSASGEAYLFYGPVSGTLDLGSADVVADGESANDRAGSAVAGGDFDGTGYADLVISAPYDDTEATDGGAAYVLWGQGF